MKTTALSESLNLTSGDRAIETVGDLKKSLIDIPDDTPIVRITNGIYAVKMDDVKFHYGMIEQDENKVDNFDCKVLLITA